MFPAPAHFFPKGKGLVFLVGPEIFFDPFPPPHAIPGIQKAWCLFKLPPIVTIQSLNNTDACSKPVIQTEVSQIVNNMENETVAVDTAL